MSAADTQQKPDAQDWSEEENAPIRYSRGRSKYDNKPQQREAPDFDAFTDAVLSDRSAEKGSVYICAPMIEGLHNKPETHQGTATWRQKHLAGRRAWQPFDIDFMTDRDTLTEARLRFARYRGFGYTTASHTPEAPRARAILATSRPMTAAESRIVGEVIEAEIVAELGADCIRFDASVYDPWQPVYTPVAGATRFDFDGEPIDVDATLAKRAPSRKEPPPTPTPSAGGASGKAGGEDFAKARKIAHHAAERTLQDPGRSRHAECYAMGCYMRRDGLPNDDALFRAALEYFAHNMRPTDAGGHLAGMDFDREMTAIRDGWHRAAEGSPVPFHSPAKQPEEPQSSISYPEPFRGHMAAMHANLLQAAHKPQPELATLACLVAMAGGVSGLYALHDGTRCNLYGLGVAMSGTGKDAPQWAAREIGRAAGSKLIGTPASGEGLEDVLENRCGVLCVADEIAHIIAALNGSTAKPHMLSLARNLLALYSAGRGNYAKRQKAAEKKGKPETPEYILCPSFSMLGFATPEKLGAAATAGNVEDGLLGRMLFAFGRDNPPHRRVRHVFELAPDVLATAEDIANASLFIDADPASGSFNAEAREAIVIETMPDADAALDDVLEAFDKQAAESKNDPLRRTLFVRSYEKVYRIAGVLAVWDYPKNPVISHEHVAWAMHMVCASNEAARRFLAEYMHGGEVQAHAAEIKRALVRLKGEKRIEAVPHSDLLKAVQKKINAREFSLAVEHLTETEEIAKITPPSGAGRRPTLYM